MLKLFTIEHTPWWGTLTYRRANDFEQLPWTLFNAARLGILAISCTVICHTRSSWSYPNLGFNVSFLRGKMYLEFELYVRSVDKFSNIRNSCQHLPEYLWGEASDPHWLCQIHRVNSFQIFEKNDSEEATPNNCLLTGRSMHNLKRDGKCKDAHEPCNYASSLPFGRFPNVTTISSAWRKDK